ncbi:MAG: immunoglobulin domain-containing protein, partial [Verrucomicrobiales bacterium]|nr:immunoglobulin domain-containing protein [Verrucomicrobiales bacterium]
NPSFEASGDVPDTGLLAPASLFGWTAEGQYGVNISGAGPYADNGTAPDQDHVAFLQGESSLKQSVRVVAGKSYQLSFAYNAPSGKRPHLRVKVGDQVLLDEDVAPVGGSAAYRTKTVTFTSSDVAHVVEFAQTKAGDETVLLDNVKIVGEVPPAVDPVSLNPEVAELGVGEEIEVTVRAPADALAVKDVRVVVQSTAAGAVRFVDPSGALTPRAEVVFAKGGAQEKAVRIRGLVRGSGNIQVSDSGGLPIRNQIAVTVVASPLKNPSFDSTPAAAGVGYGAIPGWTGGPGTGMNATGQPFADNGLIPDRKQVALVQGASFLSQEVRGLIPGKNYWLQFFYNIRNCCPPGESRMDLAVQLGGKTLADIKGIEAVGEGMPFRFHNVAFVAESATALLEFKSTPVGDATLLLDGVTLVQRDPGQVVVKNPSFEASGSVFPFPGYFDAVAGWDVGGGGRGANIDGVGPFTDNGRANAGDMVLFMQSAGSFVAQNLTDLTAGRKYLVAFLMNARACCGSEDSGITVSFNDETILEESFQPVGGANPYYIRQATFTAAGTEGVLKFTGSNGGGDHTVLLDNVVVLPESGLPPVLLSQPAGATVVVGGSATLGVAAAGGGTLAYAWKKDGQAIAGQTQPTLTLENIAAAQAGEYTVEVRNASGAVASAAARVVVLEPLPGLYDSGTKSDRTILADGDVDPHFTLVTNVDDVASNKAYAQDATKFPIV